MLAGPRRFRAHGVGRAPAFPRHRIPAASEEVAVDRPSPGSEDDQTAPKDGRTEKKPDSGAKDSVSGVDQTNDPRGWEEQFPAPAFQPFGDYALAGLSFKVGVVEPTTHPAPPPPPPPPSECGLRDRVRDAVRRAQALSEQERADLIRAALSDLNAVWTP